MKENLLHGWYRDIFYEHGAWPLWRFDLNLKYVSKSLGHCKLPDSPSTAHWLRETHGFLDEYLKESSSSAHGGVNLWGLGDLMWIRSGYESVLSRDVARRLEEGDGIAANLETPLANKKSPKWVYETFHYNAPLEYLRGFSALRKPAVFSLCNNHALDQDDRGLEETRRAVIGENFACLGGDDENPGALLDMAGTKLGFLGCTYGINHNPPGRAVRGIPQWIFGSAEHEPDWPAVSRAVGQLREAGAECIVMMSHWGYEYEYFPRDPQRKHAYKLISLGVDIILGSSPHVVQPMEIVSINGGDSRCPVQVKRDGSETPGLGVIAYSLGNFATIMPTLACRCGIMLNINFELEKGTIRKLNTLSAVPITSRKGDGFLDVRVQTLDELFHDKAVSRRDKKKLTEWLNSHGKRVLGPLV